MFAFHATDGKSFERTTSAPVISGIRCPICDESMILMRGSQRCRRCGYVMCISCEGANDAIEEQPID